MHLNHNNTDAVLNQFKSDTHHYPFQQSSAYFWSFSVQSYSHTLSLHMTDSLTYITNGLSMLLQRRQTQNNELV